jgi:uncharacterized iron-regulated membrane protein
LEGLVQLALSTRPAGHVVSSIFFPEDDPAAVVVATAATVKRPARGDCEGLHFHQFDQRTGKLMTQEPPARGFMYLVTRLHTDLFTGLPGTLFLGAMGLLLIVALVSGVVVYAPFLRKLDFATLRKVRGPRVLWLDLHNLLGIVTLTWVSVVGITGVINTLAKPAASLWQATELAEMIAPYKNAPPLAQRVPVDVVAAAARTAAPDMRLSGVNFPGTDFSGGHHYLAVFVGNTPLTSRLIKPALIDAQTGALTDIREMPWYVKVLYLSKPLHFGDYGGLPLKIIWALLTLITIVVLGSGIYLWLRKPGRARAASAPGRGQA